MRHRTAFLSLTLSAATALLALPARAADPVPPKSCSTPNGWAIQTDGLTYVACGSEGSSTCTQITYTVNGAAGSTPDHVATFLREEAGVPVTSGSATLTPPCGADQVIGLAGQTLCHERAVRFNNQADKASIFTLRVNGKRQPLRTSVVVKKGNSQGACAIMGFGFEDTSVVACVPSCGGFDPHQSVTKTEIFKFKDCEVQFDFDTTTGAVVGFNVISGPCSQAEGYVGLLAVQGPGIEPGSEFVSFGDGWVSSGDDSCTTRLIGGKYYTVCR